MTTYFISRHQGAKDWAKNAGFSVDQVTSHFNIDEVQAGDTVLGTLPIHLVAQICDRGASYYHLTLNLPEHLRGRELSAQEMKKANARLEQYTAKKISTP